jgi:hypothetical protein
MATRQSNATTPRPNGLAVGAITAAAVVLILAGVVEAMQGVVALATNEFYVATQKWLFQFDVTTWGWIHILIGLIGLATGVALLSGAFWARIVGIVIASVSVIANFLWLPYYPLWAVIIIAFDIFVIWALTAHGQDIKNV